MASNKTALYVLGLLVFGSLNTLTTKFQFQIKSIGLDGEEKFFRKPWFGVLAMFLGMIIVLPMHFLSEYLKRRNGTRKSSAVNADTTTPSFAYASMLIGIPAVLDLVATCLCFVGLLYNSASVWQMLRGSMIVFSALLSVFVLGKKLHRFHWFGVLLCCAAIVVVGVANFMGSDEASGNGASPGMVILGMVLIVIGQVIQASQVVAEEWLLRGYTVAPFHIVGMEGVWGSILMLLFVFPLVYLIPGADQGSVESSADTLVMLENSSALRSLVWLYVFSVFTYNMSGMLVTNALSAVHRTMLEASRTAVIWIVDLILFYVVAPNSGLGESWNVWSWVQLLGFAMLIMGQSIYSELIRVPGFDYPSVTPKAEEDALMQMMSPAATAYNVTVAGETRERNDESGYVLIKDIKSS